MSSYNNHDNNDDLKTFRDYQEYEWEICQYSSVCLTVIMIIIIIIQSSEPDMSKNHVSKSVWAINNKNV